MKNSSLAIAATIVTLAAACAAPTQQDEPESGVASESLVTDEGELSFTTRFTSDDGIVSIVRSGDREVWRETVPASEFHKFWAASPKNLPAFESDAARPARAEALRLHNDATRKYWREDMEGASKTQTTSPYCDSYTNYCDGNLYVYTCCTINSPCYVGGTVLKTLGALFSGCW